MHACMQYDRAHAYMYGWRACIRIRRYTYVRSRGDSDPISGTACMHGARDTSSSQPWIPCGVPMHALHPQTAVMVHFHSFIHIYGYYCFRIKKNRFLPQKKDMLFIWQKNLLLIFLPHSPPPLLLASPHPYRLLTTSPCRLLTRLKTDRKKSRSIFYFVPSISVFVWSRFRNGNRRGVFRPFLRDPIFI
jgi:hypothetical protein